MRLALGRYLNAEPDTESGESQSSKTAVDLEGVLDDQESVLGPLQEGDEGAANEAIDEDVAFHSLRHSGAGLSIRQQATGSFGMEGHTDGFKHGERFAQQTAGFEIVAGRFSIKPVSYTHLDVYKRQD